MSIKYKFLLTCVVIAVATMLITVQTKIPLPARVLIVVCVTLVAGTIFARVLTRPLSRFQALIDKISSGYLKLRIDTTSPDIMENIASSLDRAITGFAILIDISRALSREIYLDRLLTLIIRETTKLMDAERTTLFLYNKETKELWSYIAQELEIKEIRLPVGKGIAGYVAQTGALLNIKDAYKDDRFDKNLDRTTGFKTRNVLCAPMFDHKDELLGVIQVLNKKNGTFGEYDESLITALSAQAAVAIENTRLYESQEKMFQGFIRTITAVIDARDPVTRGHSERVARYTVALGKKLNMPPEQLKMLEYAAILHDVGKISIPDAVLQKPGAFTPEEYEIVKKHAVYTKDILSNIYSGSDFRDIPRIASSHHEKLDGSGYPAGLRAEDIPLMARIIAITDVYDALVSYDRPYKPAMPQEKALDILKQDAAKGKFDSGLLDAFIEHKLYEIERREHVRISTEFSIEYRVLSPEERKNLIPVLTRTRDISAGGILFLSDTQIPAGAFLEVRMHINNAIVDVIAKTVRQIKADGKYQTGITFINLSEDAKKRLAQYLVRLEGGEQDGT